MTSALGRLHADAEAVERALSAGRSAIPALAMGSDAEGVVHVGMDVHGDVVRLDLDPSWRDTLPPQALGAAVTEALLQAAEIRTGDWAAALTLPDGVPHAARESPAASAHPYATSEAGPVSVQVDEHGLAVTIDAGWAGGVEDAAVSDAVIAALAQPRAPVAVADDPRVLAVHGLARDAHGALASAAAVLPPFMRVAVRSSIDRVHDDVAQALALPTAQRSAARPVLQEYASQVGECLRLAVRPAGLPEASQVWAAAAVALTAGLAAPQPHRARWFRG